LANFVNNNVNGDTVLDTSEYCYFWYYLLHM